jgi:hypothetical protein
MLEELPPLKRSFGWIKSSLGLVGLGLGPTTMGPGLGFGFVVLIPPVPPLGRGMLVLDPP